MTGDIAIYCNVQTFSFSLSPGFATPVEAPLRLPQGFDGLVDVFFVYPTGNPASPWTYLDPIAYIDPQISIAQTNQLTPPYLAQALTYAYFSGAQPYLEFQLNLNTKSIIASLGQSPGLKAVFEVDWIPSGSRQLLIQCECLISKSVLISANPAPTPASSYYTKTQSDALFLTKAPATITTLGGIIVGSGLTIQPDGTLSATSGGSGIPQGGPLSENLDGGGFSITDLNDISANSVTLSGTSGTSFSGSSERILMTDGDGSSLFGNANGLNVQFANTAGSASTADSAGFASSAASASFASSAGTADSATTATTANGPATSLPSNSLVAVDASNNFEAPIDDSSTPTNSITPAGWLHISVNSVDSWMPYYR